jgi:hypothetical protein
MIPVGTSDSCQRPGVRRYPFIIVPIAPPSFPIPEGATYMEALVFALEPYPPEKVLADYCEGRGRDAEKFRCHAVIFEGDIREGKGRLFVRKEGDGYRMGVDRRDGKDGH